MLRFLTPAVFLAAGWLQAQQFEVTARTLPNGLKILIHEDHRLPSVAMNLFYRIGSRNERPGATGLSHFFEHMMFNGAKKYGPKQFDVQMEKNGGSNNGFTNTDMTAYTDWFPPSALELMMDMESDRMQSLLFDPKIIESERGVVYSERRSSVDNNNMGLLYEQLNAAAFMAHPYGFPVIGWASDIESWSLDDLQRHYRTGYAPNNCVMVVTGDIRTDEVMRLASRYFEPIPKQEAVPPVRTREPKQMGERRVIVRKAAQLPMLLVAWHAPQAGHADEPALEFLRTILLEGRSSRLRSRLVERDQLAIAVMGRWRATIDPNLFMVQVQPRGGVDLAKVEAAIYEEIEKVRDQGVLPREVEKARNRALTNLYQEMTTIAGKATMLAMHEVVYGDYRRMFDRRGLYEKVTAADVQRVAKTYLDGDSRTVATLIPERKEASR